MAIEPEAPGTSDDWTRSGLFEVAAGVYRSVLPLPQDALRAVNIYLLVHGEKVTVIDSGWHIPQARELLFEALAGLGAGPESIDRFLITHVHRDHYEQSQMLRREFGMGVALGIGEKPTVDFVHQPGHRPLGAQLDLLRELGADGVADAILSELAQREGTPLTLDYPDEWLDAGTVEVGPSRVLEVVPTPGHTLGHMVFHDLDAGLLFAGDHVLPTITPSIGFSLPFPDPLGRFMESLRLLLARPDAVLLPAHGPVTSSVHARVHELLAHHAVRLDQTVVGLRSGRTTPAQVADYLTWTRRERTFAELDAYNQMLAVTETAAHLELLVIQRRAACTLVDGVRHYTAV